MSDHLVVERRDAIATVTLNRPEVHNALNVATYGDLPDLVRDLDADPSVKVVVLRGAGQRSFASGADIKEFEAERSDGVKAKAYNEKVAAAEHAIEELTKPSIAMIHGYCIGGGAGLALACDIRFADDKAKFAITPSKLGLVYSLESTKRMVDLVGPARAKWVLYSGLQIPAARAYELGLFDEVVATDELEELTYGFAETVLQPRPVQRARRQGHGRQGRGRPGARRRRHHGAAQLVLRHRGLHRGRPRLHGQALAELHLVLT